MILNTLLKNPLVSTLINHIVVYPTPTSLTYAWGFGSLAGQPEINLGINDLILYLFFNVSFIETLNVFFFLSLGVLVSQTWVRFSTNIIYTIFDESGETARDPGRVVFKVVSFNWKSGPNLPDPDDKDKNKSKKEKVKLFLLNLINLIFGKIISLLRWTFEWLEPSVKSGSEKENLKTAYPDVAKERYEKKWDCYKKNLEKEAVKEYPDLAMRVTSYDKFCESSIIDENADDANIREVLGERKGITLSESVRNFYIKQVLKELRSLKQEEYLFKKSFDWIIYREDQKNNTRKLSDMVISVNKAIENNFRKTLQDVESQVKEKMELEFRRLTEDFRSGRPNPNDIWRVGHVSQTRIGGYATRTTWVPTGRDRVMAQEFQPALITFLTSRERMRKDLAVAIELKKVENSEYLRSKYAKLLSENDDLNKRMKTAQTVFSEVTKSVSLDQFNKLKVNTKNFEKTARKDRLV